MIETTHYDLEWLDTFTGDALPFSVERVQHGNHILHDHEFHELVLIESGTGEHLLDRTSWPIQRGSVFLIPAGIHHGYRSSEELKMINILFTDGLLHIGDRDLLEDPGIRSLLHVEPSLRARNVLDLNMRLSRESLTYSISLIGRMNEELHSQEGGSQALAICMLIELIVFLSRTLVDQRTSEGRKLIEYTSILNRLESNLQEPFDLESLAQEQGMSVRSYLRKFHDLTGISPLQYHNQLRIGRAKELLEKSDDSITEIGYASGYYDSSHFSRAFKKSVGLSPREFRKLKRRQES